MIKKTFLIVVTLLAMVIINSALLLAESKEEVTEFGNPICPISGEDIKEDEAIKYESAGIVYNLCCKMCLEDFKKDPEKYIKKLEA